MTGFEIGEFLATDSIDKKIVGLAIQGFGGTRKSATELFELLDVHEYTRHYLRILDEGVIALIGLASR
jgi:hypothetical protein